MRKTVTIAGVATSKVRIGLGGNPLGSRAVTQR